MVKYSFKQTAEQTLIANIIEAALSVPNGQ